MRRVRLPALVLFLLFLLFSFSFAQQGQQAPRSEPYKLGIFPAVGQFINRPNSGWDEAYAAQGLRAQAERNSSLRVVYSHYEKGLDQPRIYDATKLWSGKKPKLPVIYKEARARNLDVVFLYRGAGFYVGYSDRVTGPMPIELYLIDVKQERVYEQKGDTDALQKMTQQLISDFLQGAPRVVQASAPPAVAAPPQKPATRPAMPQTPPSTRGPSTPAQTIPLEGRPQVETAMKQALGEKGKGKGVYTAFELNAREEVLLENYKELESQALKRGLRYQDERLEDIMVRIAARVMPKPTDSYVTYRVYLLRDPSPNAFALADGQIYVHTGMLARLENESQLAGILAHEAGHVAGHHVIVKARSDRKKAIAGAVVGGILAGVGAAYGGSALGGLMASISDVGFAASMLGYSRDVEEEADRAAVGLLHHGGFDINEFARAFEIMEKDPEGLNPRIPTVWSSHPQLKDRAAHIRDISARLPRQEYSTIVVGVSEFRDRVLPVMLMTIEDYIQADYPRTALALTRQLAQRRPQDTRVLIALGNAWQALGARSELSPDKPPTDEEKDDSRRTRARLTRAEREARLLETEEGRAHYKRNMEFAREAYLYALKIDGGLAEAYRELGDVHFKLEGYEESGRAYLQYLNMRPNAVDRPLVMDKLKTVVARVKAAKGGAR